MDDFSHPQLNVFDMMPDPVIIHRNNRFLYANELALKLYGAENFELLSEKTVLELVHPDSRESMKARIDQVMHGQPTPLKEDLLLRLDGHTVSIEARGINITYEGRPAVLVIIRDITKRELAKAAQKESDEQFRTIFEMASVGIVQADPGTGRLLRFNDRYSEITGYSAEELHSMRLYELTHPDDREKDWDLFSRAVRGETRTFRNEKRYVRKDGSIAWVRINASFVRDGSDQAVHTIAICEDITDTKGMESRLAESHYLSEALNHINERLHSNLNTSEILQCLVRSGALALCSESAAISLREDDHWVVRYTHGFPDSIIGTRMNDSDDPHALLAITTRQPVAIEDAFTDPRVNCDHMRRYNVRAVLVVPLMIRNRPLGVIFFNYHTTAHRFSETQVNFAEQLAATASIALENGRLFEELAQTEAALLEAKKKLENRVMERTRDLEQANHKLMKEIGERTKAEAAIKQERQRFNDILEALPAYIVLLTSDYHVPFANRIFRERFGEAHGRRCFEYLFGRTEPCETCETFKVLPANAPHRWEWLGPDGRNYDIYDYPFKDVDGATLILEMGIDITDRKRAEDQLKVRNMAIAGSIAPFGMTDSEGKITYVNHAFLRLWGYDTMDNVTGRHITEFISTDEKSKQAMASFLKTGVVLSEEWTARKPDGTEFPVIITANIVKNEAGQPLQMVGSFLDITERRKIEQALVKSEKRYRTLVENMEDVVYSIDQDGRFRYVSSSVTKYGYTPDELTGRFLSDFVPDKDIPEFMKYIEDAATGKHNAFEFCIFNKNGETKTVRASGMPKFRDGIFQGMSGVLIDLTEQRRAEEQLRQAQKMEAVGRLAGGIAHDFNNMLSVINGYSDLVMRMLRPEDPLQDDLKLILEAGRRAASLTSQLLAFSRKQVMSPKVLNLNLLFSDMEKMLKCLIGEDIDLKFIPAQDLGNVKADPGQIEQVIMNLLINARDAMPNGGKIVVETNNAELDAGYSFIDSDVQPGTYAMLAITDTGSGMDKAALSRIFDPFFTTKEKGKGTGLGLATVHGIIRQSGGQINVYSEPGMGTTFRIYLPILNADTELYAASEIQDTSGSCCETILIVEDEPSVRNLASRILRDESYNVLLASGGSEALQICESRKDEIHLLLTDVIMPEMSGAELAKRIAAIQPGIRILYMSGYTDNIIAHHGVLDKGVNLIAKPLSRVELLTKVRDVLDK